MTEYDKQHLQLMNMKLLHPYTMIFSNTLNYLTHKNNIHSNVDSKNWSTCALMKFSCSFNYFNISYHTQYNKT